MRTTIIVILSLFSLILVGHVIWRYIKSGKMPPTEETLTFVGVFVAIIAILATMPPNGLTIAAEPTQTLRLPLSTTAPIIGVGSMRISVKDSMTQLYVPSGRFLMGSADSNAADDEKPQHEVYLDAFWMDETEVTNAQYVLFLNDVGSHLGQCDGQDCIETLDEDNDTHILRQGDAYVVEDGYADHPVTNVSWYGANAYCAWAGRALPTEAQWEKAARDADGRIYPWGNTFDGTRLNYCDSNCEFSHRDVSDDDGYARTAPVGSYAAGAGPYRVLDMAGNVWEWVADWYDSDYYQNLPPRNPPGPAAGSRKVLRGGSWDDYAHNIRAANRSLSAPAYRYSNIGFRCAQE